MRPLAILIQFESSRKEHAVRDMQNASHDRKPFSSVFMMAAALGSSPRY
jgi:hypothetical protein